VSVRTVPAADTQQITAAMQVQRLDFDDACQYVIAKRDSLTLVSFDPDFDHTDLRRQTPAQALAALQPPPRA
jgi:predicted nucleic acid-binding protein